MLCGTRTGLLAVLRWMALRLEAPSPRLSFSSVWGLLRKRLVDTSQSGVPDGEGDFEEVKIRAVKVMEHAI